MSELRQDRMTGTWVIVAPERMRRPQEWDSSQRDDVSFVEPKKCPFCPGHEAMLLQIIEQTGTVIPPGWRVRVVPNLYAVLGSRRPVTPRYASVHRTKDGFGRHEVVIESPRHGADFDSFTDDELDAVMAAYQRRYIALSALRGIETVVLFRNRGRRAGASLRHPHAQIVALGVASPRMRAIASWSRSAYRISERCITCDELAAELRSGARVVECGDGFVVLVPFAAASPFELCLAPRRHQASFDAVQPGELTELGRLLRRSLQRLKKTFGDIAYNVVIDSAGKRFMDAKHLHWRVRLIPDVVTPGGFELGTGISINPSLPESDAETLRSAAVPSA